MFEVWSNRLATIALIISIVSSVQQNTNPGSRDEVTVAVIFYTVLLQLIITKVISLPRIIQISEMFNREMKSLQVVIILNYFLLLFPPSLSVIIMISTFIGSFGSCIFWKWILKINWKEEK